MRTRYVLTRRGLVERGALLGAGVALLGSRRALAQTAAPEPTGRVSAPLGAAVGDLDGDRAIIWSKADRAARMLVELSTTESFKDGWTVQGPAALEDTDFTAKLDVAGLPAGQRIFYRVRFLDLGDLTTLSEPVAGSFATPPRERARRPLRLVRRQRRPGLGHQPGLGRHAHLRGDAAGPSPTSSSTPATRSTPTTPSRPRSTCRTAPSLEERHHRGEEQGRRDAGRVPRRTTPTTCWTRTCAASTPRCRAFAQWDDHEVLNNWYWEKLLSGRRPLQGEAAWRCSRARAKRAFLDYLPMRPAPARAGAHLPQLPLRPVARGVPARHALLPRPEQRRTCRTERRADATDFLGAAASSPG